MTDRKGNCGRWERMRGSGIMYETQGKEYSKRRRTDWPKAQKERRVGGKE